MPTLEGRPMRVAVGAELVPGQSLGGIEQITLGLVSALGRLDDGDEEYLIISHRDAPDWLTSYLGPNQRIVVGPSAPVEAWELAKRALGPLRRPLRSIWRLTRGLPGPRRHGPPTVDSVSESDGFYERLNADVIHFPYQRYIRTKLPMVYNPHDLQHLHFPEYFRKDEIRWRELLYRSGCDLAKVVVVASQWAKDDLVRRYDLAAEKVEVIPWAAPTEAYPDVTKDILAEVTARYGLGEPFALYPASTWPHKNHIYLLQALARLRDQRGLRVRMVCTGYQTSDWHSVESQLRASSLGNQVDFLGVVRPVDLRALYRLAQFVIIPSVFEPFSVPVLEAWHEGVPIACSEVAGLPEQTNGAALLFDPHSVDGIVAALQRMATDETFRQELRNKGAQRYQELSWDRTAKMFRAVYRRAAGYPLSEEDRRLVHG